MQIKALTLNICHLPKAAQLKSSQMFFWTAFPCPSLCFPAKVTNQNCIKSLRKYFGNFTCIPLETIVFHLWHQASFPLINETLQQAWSHLSMQRCCTFCFHKPADKLVFMWLLSWNMAECQPRGRHSRAHKPSLTLSSNHQGIPCSPTTLSSIMATVPKHLWVMVGVHFFGVNSNWIFLVP